MNKTIKAWAIIDGKDNYMGSGRLQAPLDHTSDFFGLLIFESCNQADAKHYLRLAKKGGLKRSYKLAKVEIKIIN